MEQLSENLISQNPIEWLTYAMGIIESYLGFPALIIIIVSVIAAVVFKLTKKVIRIMVVLALIAWLLHVYPQILAALQTG